MKMKVMAQTTIQKKVLADEAALSLFPMLEDMQLSMQTQEYLVLQHNEEMFCFKRQKMADAIAKEKAIVEISMEEVKTSKKLR